MARPLKTGIDYFPFDVDNDSKLNSLVRKFGAIGFGSFVGLLQKIYKEGYYIKINDDFIEDFEAEYDLEDGFFNDLLEFLLRRNFIDNDLYTEEKILTSNGIQKRFLEATKRRKDSSITQFSLINVDNNVNNVDNNTQAKGLVRTNVDNSTQSKVNKSKLNNTMQERKDKFYEDVSEVYIKNHSEMSKESVREFYEYWIEHGKNDTKLRFEKEKTFGISRRLSTWKKNDYNGNSNKQSSDDFYSGVKV